MEQDRKIAKLNNSRGAISVFLVLILVPCIVVVCLFGDISRVELSKAEASSAGDLALYSLMSHYDEELKEYYGLVASCQNIEEFYDVTETYFTGMMNAKGISGEGSELFTEYLASVEEGDISDFLQVEFTEAASVSEVSDSSMGDNAALLEDSIVEFMKYRGPYEIVNNILSELKSKNVLEGVSGAEKDQPIVEARQDYAEAEGELLEKAYYSYMAVKCYTDAYESKGIPSLDKYKEYEDHLGKIARDFSKITELITMYYSATDGIKLVNFPMYTLNTYMGNYQPKDIGSKVETDTGILYCINNQKFQKLLKDIDSKIQAVEISTGNITNACAGLPDPTTANSDTNPAIYCMKVQNFVSSSDLNTLSNNGRWLMDRYAQLQAALYCSPYPDTSVSVPESGDIFTSGLKETVQSVILPENDLPADWKTQIQTAIQKIESVQQKYYAGNGSSAYLAFVQKYRKTAESNAQYAGGLDTIGNVKERRYEFYSEYLGRNTRIGEFLEEVRNEFNQVETDITEQIKRLDIVIYGGSFSYNGQNYKTISLDKIKNLVITYSSRREDWGNAIAGSGSSSDYAQSEKKEYSGDSQDESAKLAAELGKAGGQAVDDLKERLVNIRQDMQDYLNSVKEFTYGGNQVTKLEGKEDVIRVGRKIIPAQADLSLSVNRKDAAGYYSSLLKPSASDIYHAPRKKNGETGNIPDLNTEAPKMFSLLKNQFDDKLTEIDQEIKENDKRNEQYKSQADEMKSTSQNVDDKYLKGKGGNLGASHGGNTVKISTAIGSIATIINNLLSGNGEELRDQIYVAEYVMDMFSYSTFNNEGQHRLAAKNNEHFVSGDFTGDGYPGYIELWEKEDARETPENQSLTNQPINTSHNQMNLGEVEYILYGNTNIDENLKTSYQNIFAIREVLNLVSGFQNFYSDSTLNGIATAIMTATGGVVPPAVTKCVLIGVIATMESAKDMDRLKAGVPVDLYKTDADSWCYSISGNKAANFDNKGEPVDENGIYYGDYMYFFLLMGVTSSETYSAILLRTGDLIEANMKKMGKQNFDLSKSRCYFSLNAELKVKPLLLELPIVNSMKGVDTNTVTESSAWCTYKLSSVRGYS